MKTAPRVPCAPGVIVAKSTEKCSLFEPARSDEEGLLYVSR
jgi:hypothetical protein